MTGSEAIKELQDNIDLPFGVSVSDEASRMAIKALEKHIPKKPNDEIKTIPVIDEDGAYVDADTYVYLLCPICGNQVGIDDCIDNYCSDCGQKLDWSDEE